VIIGCFLALLAVPIARFYRTPGAIPILIAMALIQPIQGLASPSPILFRRSLQFRKVFEINVSSAFVGLTVGIFAAFGLRNVWALVLGILAMTATLVLLSYTLHPYRPRFRFSWRSARQLSNYGRWMLGSAVLWFIFSQGSSAFSGWMFGAAALGIYQMASRFAMLASTQIGEVVQSAVMPAYSIVQKDKTRVSTVFLKTFGLAALIIIGVTAFIALGLPHLLILVLGEQWVQAAWLVPAIAIAGGARALLRIGSPLYLGTGRPRWQFLLDLIQTAVMALLLYPLGRVYGLIGLPFAVIGGVLCSIPVWWLGVKRSTSCTLREVVSVLIPPVLGVGIMTIVFLVGQISATSSMKSATRTIWHVTLISFATAGFLVTILICQRFVAHYSPLMELYAIIKTQLRYEKTGLKLGRSH
jgi:O-antigen/teichoic acid export membrane protein